MKILILIILEYFNYGNKLVFLGMHANVEYNTFNRNITMNIKNNKNGYVVIGLSDGKRTRLCPGDFIYVYYDDIPRVKNMYCNNIYYLSAKEQYLLDGRNNWIIIDHHKYKTEGWMVKVSRKFKTDNNLDFQLFNEPNAIIYATNFNSTDFIKPDKVGMQGLTEVIKHDKDPYMTYEDEEQK